MQKKNDAASIKKGLRSLVVDRFFSGAPAMRREFEAKYHDPRSAGADRFVWDPWLIPDQYRLLRTPAYHFFSRRLYAEFHRHLVAWGRENLGCHDISPPWLSCYTDGSYQRLHGDVPHGPFAFVFSLSPWTALRGAPFRGGETLLLQEDILDYWRRESSERELESAQIFEKIPAYFNRLTLFDPRIPHGVEEVRGPEDIRDGRLVIHGWFVQPRPLIDGPVPVVELNRGLAWIPDAFRECGLERQRIFGVATYRLRISPAGAVAQVKALVHSLRGVSPAETRELLGVFQRKLAGMKFKKRAKGSVITLPLVFEA